MAQQSRQIKVFYCGNDHAARTIVRLEGPVVCEKCSGNMREIGWMEEANNDGQDG